LLYSIIPDIYQLCVNFSEIISFQRLSTPHSTIKYKSSYTVQYRISHATKSTALYFTQKKVINFSHIAFLLLITLIIVHTGSGATTNNTIPLHILAVNDFHGQTMNGSPVGSIPVLGAYLRDAISRYGAERTIIALPGDITGASPAESNLLLDEPAILFFNGLVNGDWKSYEAKNESGIKVVGTLGNHEFDRNSTELNRLLFGGNGNTTISHVVDPYPGALWPVIAANVFENGTDTLILKPYSIQMIDKVPVAFIGAITIQTQEISQPMNVKSISFTDEADAINAQVRTLQNQGIHSFIVLLHEGGTQTPYDGPTLETGDLSGRVASITMRLDEDVDVVLSGHTHEFTNQYLPNAGGKPTLVTQAYSYSKAYADINLTIDPAFQDIVEKSATIVPAYADRGPGLHQDQNSQELLDAVNTSVMSEISKIIATTDVPLTRTPSENGESNLYDLATDSMRWYMDTDMAIINEGALRDDIDAGEITTGAAYTVMPFHDQILTVQLTGAQIKDLLNQQWDRTIRPDHLLQISGFSYTYDASQNPTDRVLSIMQNGSEIDMNNLYTVATTDFLAFGGDGYSIMEDGDIIAYGLYDVDIFIAYLTSLPSPIQLINEGRISIVNKSPLSYQTQG